MSNFTTPITRAANKQFKALLPEGLRIQVGAVGSFVSWRVEDPDGKLSVKLAGHIHEFVYDQLYAAGAVEAFRNKLGAPAYHMLGVVGTWERRH